LYRQVRADFGKRHRWTLVHGRHSTPVEVLLRLLIVKHLHQWSYQDTEEQVDQNLILRWFCRLYWAPVPDDTTLMRWANTLQPETLHALNDRVVQLAVQARVTKGRKLRLDATCVQTNIHHPTDSGLLVDSVRVLSRLVQRAKGLIKDQVSNVQRLCRSRLRTARQVAQTLHRQLRRTGEDKEAQQKELSQKLIQSAEQMVQQSKRVVAVLGKQTQQQAHRLLEQAQQVLPLVERVIAQTRSRVLEGRSVASADKMLSLFEPHTRAIPRHKGGALVEFGRKAHPGGSRGRHRDALSDPGASQRAWAGFGSGGASPDALCVFAQPGGRRPRGPFSRDGVTICSSRSQTGGDPSRRPRLEGTSGLGAHARLQERLSLACGHRGQNCQLKEGLWVAQKPLSRARRDGALAGPGRHCQQSAPYCFGEGGVKLISEKTSSVLYACLL
jgi:Transposase domain (DUF772)